MPGRGSVRKEKKQAVTAVKEIIDKSPSFYITKYSGMTVKQITELRQELRKSGGQYKVIKNSVSTRALPAIEEIQKELSGPIAIVFTGDDPVDPAKKLVSFIKENEKPEIIGGVVDNNYLGQNDIIKLSKLPSKEELLAKMLASMNSPIYGFVNVLAGSMRKLVYALNAIKANKGGE
ncbi:50S ribosomal protein L10 [Candidatus Margulisiibacteriota bacterium]